MPEAARKALKIRCGSDFLLKKTVCAAAALLLFCIQLNAAAADIEISPGEGFYTSDGDSEAVARTLGMSAAELDAYCGENNIVYIAVNQDNSKQIRLSAARSSFSESVGNLSGISDSSLKPLIPDITGDSGVGAEIIEKNGQKFIKNHLSASDSGGEYTVVQYITVAGKTDYVLSFYTSSGESDEYAQAVFETFSCSDFYNIQPQKSYYGYVIIAAIVLLAAGSAYIIFTLVRDIRGGRQENENLPSPKPADQAGSEKAEELPENSDGEL